MFIDEVTVHVKAGDGGNGCVSFRREKFVPLGGPNGGDGGDGGSIILEADSRKRTLLDFKYKSHFKAKSGSHGQGKNKHGKSGEDLIIKVPPGTVIFDSKTGDLLRDLANDKDQVIVAKEGQGGRGNAHFATSTRQAPKFAEEGHPGEERILKLELKLIADVGIIGCPNAGKSTLLSHISAAKPEIAAYPFTTKSPNLGVVKVGDWGGFVAADIPGLLEGAHAGTGLGDKFLRHIERTKLFIHIIDTAGVDGRDPAKDFETINKELEYYSKELSKRPQIVALNKMDLPQAKKNLEKVKNKLKGIKIYPVSAVTGEGIEELIKATAKALQKSSTSS